MEELFELVLKNPFLLLLILGWFVTMFRGKSAENEQESKQQRSEQTPPQQTRTTIGRIEPEKRPSIKRKEVEAEQTLSIEEQRVEQLERLQAQLGASASSNDYETVSQPIGFGQSIGGKGHKQPAKKIVMKRNLKHKLNHQGLVESLIMAEVLGLPRAKKRHHRDLSR